MLMNKKVAISLVAVAIVVGIGITILTNQPQAAEPTSPTTSVTSSTSSTNNNQADVATDTSGTEANTIKTENNSEEDAATLKTKYVDFSVEKFKKTEGTRVLFFYSGSSQASKDLDTDLKRNLKKLKEDTTIFKIDFNKEKEIAKAYGVVKETTVLKFDNKTQVSGVFIAYDYPTTAALVTNLGV